MRNMNPFLRVLQQSPDGTLHVSLNLTAPSGGGAAETMAAAAAGGDSFPLPASGIVMRIRNGHATETRDITLTGQTPCNFGVTHDKVITVAAVTTVLIEVPGHSQFRDTNGRIQLTYSDAGADITLAAIQR